jgi:hypothetical protein
VRRTARTKSPKHCSMSPEIPLQQACWSFVGFGHLHKSAIAEPKRRRQRQWRHLAASRPNVSTSRVARSLNTLLTSGCASLSCTRRAPAPYEACNRFCIACKSDAKYECARVSRRLRTRAAAAQQHTRSNSHANDTTRDGRHRDRPPRPAAHARRSAVRHYTATETVSPTRHHTHAAAAARQYTRIKERVRGPPP